MKRILLSLALLTTVAVGAQAQGAGLSQGEAVKQTTPNPTTTRKRCANCGITMGNITYPWQHESWCPYYRSSGGSSSSRSSSRSYGTYTAASAATTALGSLLSGLISSGFSRRNERQTTQQYIPYDPQAEAKKQALLEKKKAFMEKRNASYKESRKYWKYGDYEILANGHLMETKCYECKGYTTKGILFNNSLSIINTRTGKEIVPKLTEVFHKQVKKDILPKGLRYMEDYREGSVGSDGRVHTTTGQALIYFFDSKQQESSPLLDGMLFIDHMWESCVAYSGLCKIVDDSLQWVLKVPAPNTRHILTWYNHAEYDFNGEDFDYIPNSTCFVKKCEDRKILYAPLKDITLDSLRQVDYDKEFIYVRQNKDTLSYMVYDLELSPAFPEYPHLEPKHLQGMGAYFLIGNEHGYGIMDKKGNIVIPQIYKSNKEANEAWGIYKSISYTLWYKQEAAKYIDKKGEFEKTEHFEARMNDAKMQEEYLRDIMVDAPERYLEEKVWEKGELQLTIGEYNADEECFPIAVEIAPWNSIMLPVPMAEAKAFKKEFNRINSAAVKDAQLGIRNDAPSIESITFTMSDGKTYYYGER